jgi:hypothetical protein
VAKYGVAIVNLFRQLASLPPLPKVAALLCGKGTARCLTASAAQVITSEHFKEPRAMQEGTEDEEQRPWDAGRSARNAGAGAAGRRPDPAEEDFEDENSEAWNTTQPKRPKLAVGAASKGTPASASARRPPPTSLRLAGGSERSIPSFGLASSGKPTPKPKEPKGPGGRAGPGPTLAAAPSLGTPRRPMKGKSAF